MTTERLKIQGSAEDPYDVLFDSETGAGSCTCPGYIYFRAKTPDAIRTCKHLKRLRQERGLALSGPAAGDSPSSAAIGAPGAIVGQTKPMLATAMPDGQTVANYAGRSEWAMERKYDGWRMLVRKNGDALHFWGRPRGDKQSTFKDVPEAIKAAIRQLPDGVYDGELFVPGGTSSDVSTWLAKARVNRFDNPLRVIFYDVLEVLGENVTDMIWSLRHDALLMAVEHHNRQTEDEDRRIYVSVAMLDWTEADIQAIWNDGGEGAILKRTSGLYRPGWRSTDWIKVKRLSSITMRVTGFEAGEFGPHSKVLLVSQDGKIESSVKTKNGDWLKRFNANADAYIDRLLVVEFTEYTPDGGLRHPRFDHFAGESE